MLGRPKGCLQPVLQLELLADIGNMGFDGVQADEQPGSNLFVGGAGRKMDQDVFLPAGQMDVLIFDRALLRLVGDVLHKDPTSHPHFAAFEGANPFENGVRLIAVEKKAAHSQIDIRREVGITGGQVEQGNDVVLQVWIGLGLQHFRDGGTIQIVAIDKNQTPFRALHAAGMGNILDVLNYAGQRRFIGPDVIGQEIGGELIGADDHDGPVLELACITIKLPTKDQKLAFNHYAGDNRQQGLIMAQGF